MYDGETNQYYGYIYKIINDINERIYIGQTIQKYENRWKEHITKSYSKNINMAITRAINLLGVEHFKLIPIETIYANTKEDLMDLLNQKESYYISLYKSLCSQNGYNILSVGGNYKHSKRARKVLCLNSSIIFDSCSDAARYYDLDSSSIRKCCIGKYTHTHNLHFIYLDNYDGNINNLQENKDIKPSSFTNKRKINMYDKNFNYVCTYESVTEAADKNNKTLRIIIKSCNSKHSFNYGKTFYYADDPNQPDETKIINSVSQNKTIYNIAN